MSEDKNDTAPQEQPKKTLSMKSLEKQMNADNQAMADRMDTFEEEIGGISSKMDSLMSLLDGMTAQHRPIQREASSQDAEDLQHQMAIEAEIADTPDGLETQIKIVDGDVELNMEQEKALEFERDILEITLLSPQDSEQDQFAWVSVNGISFRLARDGETIYKVPRFIVGCLAHAKPNTFDNKEYVDPADGVMKVKWPIHTGLRYPFSVIHDPRGKQGLDWLRGVLQSH